MLNDTLFLFVDESGNFDFSRKGTPLFMLSGLVTKDIVSWTLPLQLLKHEIMAQGYDLEEFHATEDYQWIRNSVFQVLTQPTQSQIHTVIVPKLTVPLIHQSPEKFYPAVFKQLMQQLMASYEFAEVKKLVLILDEIPYKQKRESLQKGVKEALSQTMRLNYHLFFHDSRSNFYLQAIDYFNWAIYVKWTRGEERPYQAIQTMIFSEHEMSFS